MTKKFGLSLATAAAFALVLAGCNGSNGDNNGGPIGNATSTPSAGSTGTPNGTANGTGTPSGTANGTATPRGTANGTATPNGTASARVYVQQDRLARPLTNEVLATVSNDRHKINNKINPPQDRAQLGRDIFSFFKFPAGRSDAIANVAVSVLTPDMMMADLSQSGPAAFLGVETGGATGGKFGGRKLQDDVVDIDLGVIFGNTVPALGLAPDDGKELPQFTTDNVGFQGNALSTFPYIGNPV